MLLLEPNALSGRLSQASCSEQHLAPPSTCSFFLLRKEEPAALPLPLPPQTAAARRAVGTRAPQSYSSSAWIGVEGSAARCLAGHVDFKFQRSILFQVGELQLLSSCIVDCLKILIIRRLEYCLIPLCAWELLL